MTDFEVALISTWGHLNEAVVELVEWSHLPKVKSMIDRIAEIKQTIDHPDFCKEDDDEGTNFKEAVESVLGNLDDAVGFLNEWSYLTLVQDAIDHIIEAWDTIESPEFGMEGVDE